MCLSVAHMGRYNSRLLECKTTDFIVVINPNLSLSLRRYKSLVALPPVPKTSLCHFSFLCLSYYQADNWTVTPASQWAESRWKQQSLSGVTTEIALWVYRDANGRFHALTLTALLSKQRGECGGERKQEAWPSDLADISEMSSMLFCSLSFTPTSAFIFT